MTTKLFSESLKEIRTSAELATLQSAYPEYDAGYLCQAAGFTRRKAQVWMEELWENYRPHADSQFRSDFRRQFSQRSWELYLGATFLNRGLLLGKHSNAGPDFRIENDKGELLTWVEAVAPDKGNGNDRVPDMRYGVASTIPEDEMLLRLTSVLDTKHKKYQADVSNGLVKDDEPYVIAINRSGLDFLDAELPLILKAVFAIGHLTLQIKVGGVRQKNPKSFWSARGKVSKRNGSDVPTLFFMDENHAGISAVIYCVDNILNSPRPSKKLGENFVVAHNPYAKNPLPAGFFPFGEEYKADGEYVKKVRKQKKWERPSPFDYLN